MKKKVVSDSVTVNRKASFDYILGDELTVGMALSGLEVRSIRDHHVQLKGSFVTIRGGELWLNNLTLGADTALALSGGATVASGAATQPISSLTVSGAATLAHYEGEVERFVDWMAVHYPEAKEMRQVSRDVAAAFLADFGAKVSPNTYNKYVSLLRLVWRTIGEEAKCGLNPWDGVRRKVQPKTNGRRALTVDELAKVTADLTGEMRLLFAFGIYTGLRLGDCALMEWGKIDMVRRAIITTPRKTAKNGKEVEIPLHPVLYALLDETPEQKRSGYVMPETAELYERDNSAVAKRIRAIFEGAGIATTKEVEGYSQAVAEVGFHSLRHSFVSLMGNAGAPLALVQSIVGHANPMMTAHYFHARTDALANAVGNLPMLMGETVDAAAISADAPTGHAERDANASVDNVLQTPKTRLETFKAAFLAMSSKERKAAMKWIAKKGV